MLDKIRKLLAQAEDPACTPAEAEAFNQRAADLIAKYGIDKALLDAAKAPATKEDVDRRKIHVPGPYAWEKSALLYNIGEPLNVHTVRHNNGRRSDGYKVSMFGFPSDLERVELLFTSLLVQASHSLATIQPPPWESTVSYRKAWMWGFINTVKARLVAAESRAAREADERGDGPSTALVLADRKTLVDRRVEEAFTDLKRSKSVTVKGSGYRDGQAAGQRADLGGSRLGQAPGAAIGR